jgi:hypothetical protein
MHGPLNVKFVAHNNVTLYQQTSHKQLSVVELSWNLMAHGDAR